MRAAAKAKGTKVPVTERALIQRINRKLAADNQLLRTARYIRDDRGGWYPNPDLGRYYVIDLNGNLLIYRDVDLEQLARELAAIAPWEQLAAAE
jgi:hypothetical protein